MRIALVDAFPNIAIKAELEFGIRFERACTALGIDCVSVITSDDIRKVAPDLVVCTHEFTRKLTEFPTIGLLWSPLSFFQNDEYRLKSVLSYDGYLVGSAGARTFVRDFQAGLGIEKPVGEGLFLPTSNKSETSAFPRTEPVDLTYLGVHWDGDRHGSLLKELAKRDRISLYGPAASWKEYESAYRGSLPFDGVSVVRMLSRNGASLCLHRPEHRAENTPSMRIFETLAAGAVLICDDIPFAKENLEGIAYFLDVSAGPRYQAGQVEEILREINSDLDRAAVRAARGREWFNDHWSLESKISTCLLPLYEQVVEAGKFEKTNSRALGHRASNGLKKGARVKVKDPVVEIIIRAGSRPVAYLEQALLSVERANSNEVPLGVVLVDFSDGDEIDGFAAQWDQSALPIRLIKSKRTGFRSTALWDGLRALKAPFVCHLDDDDTVHGNHYRQLHDTLTRNLHSAVAYSGVIKYEEESGFFVNAPNFDGPLARQIRENCDIKFLDSFDLPKLARLDNYIQSNAWMARTEFIKGIIGADPELVVTEDTYLYLLMASRGPFMFSGSPTAVWHWRSASRDNSMLQVDSDMWEQAGQRIKRRLQHVPFLTSGSIGQISQVGMSENDLSQKSATTLPPLRLNYSLVGGVALASHLSLDHFHTPEGDGIWTSGEVAEFRCNPTQSLRAEGGFLILKVQGVMAHGKTNAIEVEIDGGAMVTINITDWEAHTVSLPLKAGLKKGLHVYLRSKELLFPNSDVNEHRTLGVFLKGLVASERPYWPGEVEDLEGVDG